MRFTGGLPPGSTLGLPSPTFVAALPALSITSVGGVSAPAMPSGSFNLPPDLSLPPGTTTATVQLAATGIPTETTVTVTVTPKLGAQSTVMSTPLTGTQDSSTASADVTLISGVSIISAEATFTVVAAAGSSPIVVGSIDGERIDKIRVSAVQGGASSLTYITASGREVPVQVALSKQ
jgi:hypothetical protein